jgi:hypothetical protein
VSDPEPFLFARVDFLKAVPREYNNNFRGRDYVIKIHVLHFFISAVFVCNAMDIIETVLDLDGGIKC